MNVSRPRTGASRLSRPPVLVAVPVSTRWTVQSSSWLPRRITSPEPRFTVKLLWSLA